MRPEELMRKYKYGYIHSKVLLKDQFVKDLIKEIESLKKEKTGLEKLANHNYLVAEDLRKDLTYVLHQVYGGFCKQWCIDWNFSDIRKKHQIKEEEI